MVDIETFRHLALMFNEATEQSHFEKTSFRVRKKIFATLDIGKHRAVVKLTEIDQSVFCSFDRSVICPVEGTWGLQGWTMIDLKKIDHHMLLDALTTSYCSVAPKSLAVKYKHE